MFNSPQKLLESAQTYLNTEQWEEAAKTLDEFVDIVDSPAASVHYDRGIAHYNIGAFDQASKAFEDAMASTTDITLSSYCAYNFGNSVYQSTMQSLEGTTNENGQEEAIIELEYAKMQLKNTIDSYRRSIKKNQNDMDARANGELAWKMLQQLDEMQEEMEQQQKQQQDDQNQEQQQDEESAQEQADNQENTEQGDSQKEKQEQQEGEQSESQEQDSSENQQGDQSENQTKQNGDQSENQQKKQQDSQSSEQPNEDTGDHSSPQEQKEGEQTQQDTQTQQPNASDETSEQELTVVNEGNIEAANEDGLKEAVDPKDTKEEGERLTRSEASRLLQLIRDKEQQRRKLLAARKAARRVPVQKDW